MRKMLMGHDGGKDSSSADERCTEPKTKRPKRLRGQLSPAPDSGDGAGDGNDQEGNKEAGVLPAAPVGTSEMLVWGKGGMRSNIRYGSTSGTNGKNSRTRIARLTEHLRNSKKNDNEVMLVSLDEQEEPLLQHPYLSARPALSVGQLCEFISRQTSCHLKIFEILGVKGPLLKVKLYCIGCMQRQAASIRCQRNLGWT
ncbi:putative E3 ubiquitin-protein ligase RING1a [Bienertia sinuspersici]